MKSTIVTDASLALVTGLTHRDEGQADVVDNKPLSSEVTQYGKANPTLAEARSQVSNAQENVEGIG